MYTVDFITVNIELVISTSVIIYTILLGTGKWILSALVDSKNEDMTFFIGPDAQKTINAKLQAIAAPHDMERKPRLLEYIKRWKGNSSANIIRVTKYEKELISCLITPCLQSVQSYKIVALLHIMFQMLVSVDDSFKKAVSTVHCELK